MICTCFFCERSQPHPDNRHPDFVRISDQLLVAESLDPKDRIAVVACITCGHKRPMDEADTQ